jgi:uracil-DNA glycosylase
MGPKTQQMLQIQEEITSLVESPLYGERVKNSSFPVIGDGSLEAKIMIIGEAPGKNEANTGIPFCGASGKILDQLLEHISIPRQKIYITNVVKDRPPKNRNPNREEISIYSPFLDRQISIIMPRIIIPLGKFSMEYILTKYGFADEITKISGIRGRVFKVKLPYGEVSIVPMFHPAVGVYNRTKIPMLKKDMEIIKSLI